MLTGDIKIYVAITTTKNLAGATDACWLPARLRISSFVRPETDDMFLGREGFLHGHVDVIAFAGPLATGKALPKLPQLRINWRNSKPGFPAACMAAIQESPRCKEIHSPPVATRSLHAKLLLRPALAKASNRSHYYPWIKLSKPFISDAPSASNSPGWKLSSTTSADSTNEVAKYLAVCFSFEIKNLAGFASVKMSKICAEHVRPSGKSDKRCHCPDGISTRRFYLDDLHAQVSE